MMKKRHTMIDFFQQLMGYLESVESRVEDPELGPDAFYILESLERRVCKAVKRASKTDMAKGLAMQS
jgi:hypothetical protein